MRQRRLAIVVLALVLLFGAGLASMLMTESGLRLAFALAVRVVPGVLEVRTLEGRLIGPIEARGLRYRDQRLSVAIDRTALDWRVSALALGELRLTRLQLEEVQIDSKSATGPVDSTAAAPFPVALHVDQATVHDLKLRHNDTRFVLRRGEFAGRADTHDIKVEHLMLEADEWRVRATGHAAIAGPLAFDVEWMARVPAEFPLHGRGSVRGTPQRLELTQAIGGALRAEVDAVLTLGGDKRRADVRWRALAWPADAPRVRSEHGELTLEGDIEDFAVRMQGRLAADGLPAGQWSVEGRGSRQALELARVDASILGGKLEVQGNVWWAPVVRWNLVARGEALDPAAVWPGWPGRLALEARTQGEQMPSGPAWRIDVERLHGSLRGRRVDARGTFARQGARYELRDFRLTSDRTRLDAEARLAREWDVRFDLDTRDLDLLLPEAAGHLVASGRLQGTLARPQLHARANATELQWHEWRIAAAHGESEIVGEQVAKLHLVLDRIDRGGARLFGQAMLEAGGSLRDHHATLTARGPRGDIELAVRGAYQRRAWSGALESAAFAPPQGAVWRLDAAGPLRASTRAFTLGPWCWSSEPGRLCLEANGDPSGPWQSRAHATELPLALLSPWLPGPLDVSGHVTAAAHLDMRERLEGAMSLTARDGRFGFAAVEAETALAYEKIDVRAQLDDEGAAAELDGRFGAAGHARVRLRLPHFRPESPLSRDQRLSAALDAELNELALLAAWLPARPKLGGRLRAELEADGTLGAPQVRGAVRWLEGSADVTEFNIRLSPLQLEADFEPPRGIRLDARARSGEGELRLNAHAQLDDNGIRIEGHIRGENFLAANLRQARLQVSPDVRVTVEGRAVQLEGTLAIPRAQVVLELPRASVEPSRDVVVIGDEAKPAGPASRWSLRSDLRLVLGDQVRVSGYGFRGRVRGDLRLIEEPDQVARAQGELVISEGRYRAYGQDLGIEQGRLVYAGGPVDNPGIDARAVRRVGEVTAGIRVTGTLKQPAVAVFSDPAMSDTDALAYLVLGRPLPQATQEEGKTVANAALALQLAGGDLIAGEIGARFGFDELTVQPGATSEEAALVIGRYLTPRLYLNYSVGLFEQMNVFRVRYQITPRWTLEGETGIESGADLIFTIER